MGGWLVVGDIGWWFITQIGVAVRVGEIKPQLFYQRGIKVIKTIIPKQRKNTPAFAKVFSPKLFYF